MTKKVKLLVNDSPIPLDYFVEGFLDHTVSGMVAALEGTGEIQALDLAIDGDTVSMVLNDSPVTLKLFVSTIIRSTVTGMISVLKGVETTGKVRINIQR
ncbi:hypothetical protein ACFLWN_04680 [Chloroflexota bacterium]